MPYQTLKIFTNSNSFLVYEEYKKVAKKKYGNNIWQKIQQIIAQRADNES